MSLVAKCNPISHAGQFFGFVVLTILVHYNGRPFCLNLRSGTTEFYVAGGSLLIDTEEHSKQLPPLSIYNQSKDPILLVRFYSSLSSCRIIRATNPCRVDHMETTAWLLLSTGSFNLRLSMYFGALVIA